MWCSACNGTGENETGGTCRECGGVGEVDTDAEEIDYDPGPPEPWIDDIDGMF